MRKKVTFLFILLTLPFLILAQSGSATEEPSSIGSVEVATSTPRVMPSSSVTLPKEESVSMSTSTGPSSSTGETPEPIINAMELPRSMSLLTLVGLAALTGLVAFLLYGVYKLKTKKESKNDSDKDKENDKSRCFDIKKLMDQKLEEITDLKSQLEDRVKDKTRAEIKEIIKETQFAEMLSIVEAGEKEYKRLKSLFDQCMIEFGADKKRVFIVHGWSGHPQEGWFPWLKKELEKLGYEVFVPAMSNNDSPVIEEWVSHLAKIVGKPDEATFFVGHSIGCQTILRYIDTLPENTKVGGAIFIAGWFNLENMEDEKEEETARPWIERPINLKKVKDILLSSALIISDNDPYGAFIENKKKFTELGSKIIVLHNAGHITEEDGYVELKEALEEFENL